MVQSGDRARAEHTERHTIGQVISLLSDEHPGITVPKLRFLESEGLVTPERTASKYRQYSNADVERLRYVLRMQRDHYLPLKVIKQHLEAMDAGQEPPAIESVAARVPLVALSSDGLPSAESFRARSDLRLSRRELLKVAGITEDTLAALEEYGLVRALPGTGHFDADALVIANTAKELATHGLEPRHLRAFRAAADREVGLVRQVVAPIEAGRHPAARGRAEQTAVEVAALAMRLHATLVKSGLQRP